MSRRFVFPFSLQFVSRFDQFGLAPWLSRSLFLYHISMRLCIALDKSPTIHENALEIVDEQRRAIDR